MIIINVCRSMFYSFYLLIKRKTSYYKQREKENYLFNSSILQTKATIDKFVLFCFFSMIFFEFVISFFLGLADQVEMLSKVGKELDGMWRIENFFFIFFLELQLKKKNKVSSNSNWIDGFKFFSSLSFSSSSFLFFVFLNQWLNLSFNANTFHILINILFFNKNNKRTHIIWSFFCYLNNNCLSLKHRD